MADKIFGLPFNDDIFVASWHDEPDPTLLALRESGVLLHDPTIASAIGTEGNFGTMPYYTDIGGDPVNYDGATDITLSEAGGDYLSFVVYGRAKGWKARDFVADLSSGDPMGNIVKRVARYWHRQEQARIIGVMNAVFGISGDSQWATHVIDKSVDTGDKVLIDETTLHDAAVATLGDNAGAYSIAVMHSAVAKTLQNLQLLEYRKGTDALGMQRNMNIADCNGFTVIIDDGVPVDTTKEGFPKYTTYLLGTGALRTSPAAVKNPVEVGRNILTNGGEDFLATRVRGVLHPNGFSYSLPASGFTGSPTDAQLFASARYTRKYPAKALPMAKIVTNG